MCHSCASSSPGNREFYFLDSRFRGNDTPHPAAPLSPPASPALGRGVFCPLTRRRLCRRRPLDGQGRGVLGPLTRRRLCRRRPLPHQGRGVFCPLTRRRLCRRRPLPHQGRGVLGPLTRRRLCRRRPLDGQGRGVLGPVFHCCEGRSPGKHQHDGQFFRGKDTQADRANGPGHPPIGGFSLLKIFPQFACIPSTPNYNRLLLE